jgi:MFS family permease
MTPATTGAVRGALWRQRDFRVFWTGETTSQLGSAVTVVALPLVAVNSLHADTFVVTLLTASTWLPWVAFGLPAGAWVDRLPRRPVMLACDAVSFVAFASVPAAAWAGVLSIAQLVAVALTAGGASVFFSTAYEVYLPSIVDQGELTEANAKLTGSRSAAQVAGPGLGGAIAQAVGAATALLADAVSFAVSFACLVAIGSREGRIERTSFTAERHLRREIRDGLRFVVADPFLRPQLVFGASANLFLTGMEALLVVFLVRAVGTSPGVVGLLLALGLAGGVAGAAVARPLARRWGTARTVLVVAAGGLPFALLMPLTERGPGLALFVAALFMVAGGVVASNVITGSFRQTYVPAGLLGRVSACVMTISYATMPVGAVLAGVLGQSVGVRTTLWFLAGGITASSLVYLLSPMRRLRDLPTSPTGNLPGVEELPGSSGVRGRGSPGALRKLRYSASKSASPGHKPTSRYKN